MTRFEFLKANLTQMQLAENDDEKAIGKIILGKDLIIEHVDGTITTDEDILNYILNGYTKC